MKRIRHAKMIIVLAAIVSFTAPLASEPREILSIRKYYNELLQKIEAGTLYTREMHLTYEVIPGIGAPSSRAVIYYDLSSKNEGRYTSVTLRIENYYQHAGRALYEEFIYKPDGSLAFYYGRAGSGDIRNPKSITWVEEERYYFSGERLIRVMRGNDIADKLSANDLRCGAARLQRARQLWEKDCNFRLPRPFLF